MAVKATKGERSLQAGAIREARRSACCSGGMLQSMPQRVDQSRNAAACTGLGVHMVHAPQASVRQVDLVRILAGVVAADVFVGAGHAARLEPADSQ